MADLRWLVSQLDLDQKIAQLQGIVPMDMLSQDSQGAARTDGVVYDVTRVAAVRPHGVGHLSLAGQLTPDLAHLRSELARFQEVARDATPFGIGVLVHAEGINGLVHPQGFQFPTAWGQAASWDPAIAHTVADVAARQARDIGIHVLFSPLLDVARDIRWGRVHETYGEDPELIARMGIAFIQGIEGDGGESGVLATAKHFVGYGHSLGGLNQAVTQLGIRELVDVYAAPFRRAIAEANLSIIMSSYNEVDGLPATSHRWLLSELLREQLKFAGLVVSDYGAFSMLHSTYLTAPTPGHAAGQAITAGVDVELPSDATTSALRPLIESGEFPEEAVDRAVLNVLRVKDRLGLVPATGGQGLRRGAPPITADEAHVRGRDVAERAVTLLANDGVLPLVVGKLRVAVVGPAADELRIHFGAYTSVSDGEMPVAVGEILAGNVPGIDASPDVLPDMFQTRLPGVEPLFEEGARRLHPEAATLLQGLRAHDPSVSFHPYGSFTDQPDLLDIDGLIASTETADVVIAAVGERTGWFGNHTAGEGRTVACPHLPGDQNALITALAAAGRTVVTVVVTGRPLLLDAVDSASAAVLVAPLLGPHAGSVIADVLYGRVEPTGRTPSTFPRALGQIPLYHGHPIGSGYDHPHLQRYGYTDLPDSTPLYPFGHGLGYTSFEVLMKEAAVIDGVFRVNATVRNTGLRSGTTTVQLYARDEAASVVRPVRQLLDFARATVRPGQEAPLQLSAPVTRLAYTAADGRRGVEAGDVTLLLGLSSADIASTAVVRVDEQWEER